MEHRKRRNLLLLSFAFFFTFSAYKLLANIQGSINKELGTLSLSFMYTSMLISAFFLAPLMMNKFGCKVMMAFSILCHTTYPIANFYPRIYTMIPAGILTGVGSGFLYPCMAYYINCLAGMETEHSTNLDKSKTVSVYLGLFYTILNLSYTFGGVCMSIIVQLERNTNKIQIHAANFVNSSGENILDLHNGSFVQCGLFHHHPAATTKLLNNMTLYIMLSVFLLFEIVSFVMMLFLDNLPHLKSVPDIEKYCDEEKTLQHEEIEIKLKQVDAKNNYLTSKIISTVRLLTSDLCAALLIPFTFHYGLIESFLPGVFNTSWITCSLGVEYVAYTTVTYGIVLSTGSFLFGYLMKWWTHVKLFVSIALLEISLLVLLLLWQPEKGSSAWPYFLVSMGIAVCHSAQAGQLASVYSRFFRDKESSSALLFVWDPLGSATFFAIVSTTPPFVMVLFLLLVSTGGTTLYLLAEYRLKQRK